MASINKVSKKPISERISMFESPTGSTNTVSTPSSSGKNSSTSANNKINITKTLSKTNFVALKSQFDSGRSTSSQSQIFSKISETKSVASTSSPSQSQQSSAASSSASTPAPTPTPPPQNPATISKSQLACNSGGDSSNAQKERRKLPATPKPSSTSSSSASPNKPALKSSGSGGRSAVVASSKQASAGASAATAKTPVSRTPVSGSKSTHREHIPLHKKSSPNSGTSTSHPFGGSVKQRSPTAPIPASHAAKKVNNSSHSTDKINNNNSSITSTERQIPQGVNTSNINANKNNKSSSSPNQGPTSINRVKAPVTKTLSSPLTPPKFATNNVTINVNNNYNEDDNNILSDENTERLHSTTIQTTTSTIKSNQGISVNQQQHIEVKKVNNSNTFLQQGNKSYSTNQELSSKNENRKNSDEYAIGGEKSMSSSESSDSASPPSASPPPPPILAPLIVPTVTVTLEPNNLNNKNSLIKSPLSADDEVDTTVANNNFKNIVSMQTAAMNSNSTITGGRNQQYWTNQALQNDNSKTIKEAMKLDLDFKEEKIGALNQELEELQVGGGASEEEVSSLKRQKHDLEMRLKDQEEELDDLAGQVQMLEQAKTKLEMSMAAQKKEHRREVSAKDDELEDARTSTQKKVKVLEQQLESEHEERINFMREKHELETKIINLQELANRSADEEQVAKLKKDLKRTKALLKDAQLMIEKSRNESSNKVVLRQLKNQLEDTEFARMAAVKAKQNVELEVADLQLQLDDVCRNKSDLEDKMLKINREKADLSSQLEDNEEEMSEVMKKYKASVSQLSVDQITIQQQACQVSDLEEERNKLKEQLAEMSQKIESLEGDNVSTAQHQRLELKIKELESKLELEQTTRGRMDTQITRLKEAIEKINHECDSLRVKEATSQDQARRLQRQLRDLKENYTTLQQKETEVNAKKNEYEKKLELAEAETVTARNDLKLALKRVEDLQQAINGELDSDLDSLNSDADSDSSDELVGSSFMEHHRRAISVQRERESIARDISARESIQREVRASIARESVARQLQTMPEEPELKMSEMMSNKRINEGDNDLSSDEDNDDKNTTQQREDAIQQSSIDGTIEESQA